VAQIPKIKKARSEEVVMILIMMGGDAKTGGWSYYET
jgi:hypothetical protein